MVGLHTCGDLAPNTLRIFTSNSEIKGVCSVGCCYHLLSEEFENPHKGTKFTLSQNFIYFGIMAAFYLSIFCWHYCYFELTFKIIYDILIILILYQLKFYALSPYAFYYSFFGH